jgi:hypothetical protein
MSVSTSPLANQSGEPTSWPEYLASYESLVQHFRAQLEGLSTSQKGQRFARLVQRLLPQTDIGANYLLPEISATFSNDEGVDLVADAKIGPGVLYTQAKLWLDRVDDFDSVLSKFEAYLTKYHTDTGTSQYRLTFDDQSVSFSIVTLSKLKNVIQKYTAKQFSSRPFYDQLCSKGRLHIVDGSDIFALLRGAYLKLGELPRTLTVPLAGEPLHKDNVYMGIISSQTLKALYSEFGDALFFENVRDFLDPTKTRERTGRTTPNLEIIRTVTTEPHALLSRNNGIVFRAEMIEFEKPDVLRLIRGSIVNGCQTTMCVVLHSTEECFVPVKLVQTDNAWDVAKAANYQNSVNDIDLELARHLRPQVVKRAANISGVKIDDGKESAFQIIDSIYEQRVAYQETRLIYIGLFSRQPNNLYASNYTEINGDLISRFYQEDRYGNDLFETLFGLQGACQEALADAQQTFGNTQYSGMFDRYYKDDSPTYRCFVGILALCGAVKTNVAEHNTNPEQEFSRMKNFIADAARLLRDDRPRFRVYYRLALKIWMSLMIDAGGDEQEIRQLMNLQSRKADFSLMFKKLCLEADVAESLTRKD